MSRLNLFISSTCYDMDLIRSELRPFLESFGHNPVMSDYGDVIYDPRVSTHESCVKEASSADVLVLIIGGRYGGTAIPEVHKHLNYRHLSTLSGKKKILEPGFRISITQAEALIAIQKKIPVYTFIKEGVLQDHYTYEINKPNSVKYPSIEKQETAEFIFEFINFIRTRTNGNSIFPFKDASSIKTNLSRQLSGVLARLLRESSASKKAGKSKNGKRKTSRANQKQIQQDRLSEIGLFFREIDSRFENEINPGKRITKGQEETIFSSGSLFASLVRIGIPPIQSMDLCKNTIFLLRDYVKDRKDKIVSTSDIRSCVLRAINALQYSDDISEEEIKSWCISYIRRYGSDNSFVRVIDRGEERDLTVKYLKDTIIPHVISRILGLPHSNDPLVEYKEILSQTILRDLASISQRLCNQLNIYSLRYKTLIQLLQDYLLEPPHPVLVSPATQKKIVNYNLDKARNHYQRIIGIYNEDSTAIDLSENSHHLSHAANECMMHSCAAILASYGSYLGYEQKYGYIELARVLKLYESDPDISCWYYCTIRNVSSDLKKINISIAHFISMLERVRHFATIGKFDDRTMSMVDFFYQASSRLIELRSD